MPNNKTKKSGMEKLITWGRRPSYHVLFKGKTPMTFIL